MGRDPEYVKARVVSLIDRYRDGTVVLLDYRKAEGERFWIPTWKVAEGDWIEGPFVRGKRFWHPPKRDLVKVFPRGMDPVARELGQVIYSTVPALGYRRALSLGKRDDAFDYLLGHKDLSDLFTRSEKFALEEALAQLAKWRWFFEALKELMDLGFTPMEGQRILDALGEPAVSLARKNPFLMTQVEGVEYAVLVARFRRRDRAGEFLQRIKESYTQGGHTAVEAQKLAPNARILGELIEEAAGQVRAEKGFVALTRFADWEEEIYDNAKEPSSLPEIAPPEGLGEDQKQVVTLLRHRIGVLTGGPGTGKTFTLSRIVNDLRTKNIPVTLVAPTGKAAQRMTQLAGIEAKTVHSFLELKPHEVFKAAGKGFPKGLVVLDEASMLDLETMVHVVRALPEGSSLLLVGDVDQLPPVQPGQPFADLVRFAPSVRLQAVRRQTNDGAALLEVARCTLDGKPWLDAVKKRPNDFLYRRVTEVAEAYALIEFVVSYYLDQGYDVDDIQVLTPIHEGPLGTKALNARLRAVFRGKRTAATSRHVELGDGHLARVGEKIIFGENRFSYGIANGTMGIVEAIDDYEFTVRVGKEYLVLPRALAAQASLAYAMTVHRSQGSEWKVVVLALPDSVLTTRRLVYTGLTRAKEQAVVVTTLDLLKRPVAKDRERMTWLSALLDGKGEQGALEG